jgi:hypothetical protein
VRTVEGTGHAGGTLTAEAVACGPRNALRYATSRGMSIAIYRSNGYEAQLVVGVGAKRWGQIHTDAWFVR